MKELKGNISPKLKYTVLGCDFVHISATGPAVTENCYPDYNHDGTWSSDGLQFIHINNSNLILFSDSSLLSPTYLL